MRPKQLKFRRRRQPRLTEIEDMRQLLSLRSYTPDLLRTFIRIWHHQPWMVKLANEALKAWQPPQLPAEP